MDVETPAAVTGAAMDAEIPAVVAGAAMDAEIPAAIVCMETIVRTAVETSAALVAWNVAMAHVTTDAAVNAAGNTAEDLFTAFSVPVHP